MPSQKSTHEGKKTCSFLVPAYLVGIHRYSFRAGKPAEIKGVRFVCFDAESPTRLCYCVQFEDGVVDYVPVEDSENYQIISEEYIRAGNIPKVVN